MESNSSQYWERRRRCSPTTPAQLSNATSRRSSSGVSRTEKAKEKAKEEVESSPKGVALIDAIKWRNIDELKKLAVSKDGFLSDSFRRQAWPVLLGLPTSADGGKETAEASDDRDGSWKELPKHRDEEQVQLDVNRAFIYYPNLNDPAELEHQKSLLSDLIVSVLRRNPHLCYFQGYHDICQVFLLVLSPAQTQPAVSRLSALRIRDFMLPNLAPAVAQLRLLPDILEAADRDLWRHLSGTEPFFALSGTLTMYAHDVQTLGEISRLFDALLAMEPAFSVYLFASIVLSRRAELFDTPASEPEMLHSILSKLPQPLDLDALIAAAAALFERFPPERLPAWRGISRASVLKTARDSARCADMSMEEGGALFEMQVRELEWAETKERVMKAVWRYRRPARAVGFAVAFGVLAFWLRRWEVGAGGGPLRYIAALFSRLMGW